MPPPLAEGELWIGVSIAIPDPYGDQLADARARFRDPAASLIPPHVTLLGPTKARRDDLGTVDAYLTAVAARHRPFGLRLAGAATFRPISPVAFVQVVEGAPACAALADELRTGPLGQDLRFEYHPHVTVAQGVDDDLLDAAETGMADFAAEFSVTGFSRYEHGTDGLWRPARAFGLAALPV